MVVALKTGLLPWLTPLAALGVVLTMIGAALTHLRRSEYSVVTSGIGATLHVIRVYVGEATAEGLAREIGYPDQRVGDEPRIPADRLTASDRALYVLSAAYGWGKPKIGAVLTEGASEIELASVFDDYPGPAFTSKTTSLASGGPRSPVESEHGLYFVPRSDLEGAPTARFTARLLEYPTGHLELAGDGWPFAALLLKAQVREQAVREPLGKQVAPDKARAVAAATELPLSVTKRGALLFARKDR